ncbi:polyA glycohydrolase, putative [Pediculus humanus corporis]|uniref:poly(ADP-ribose) glycohydrolase n=1 Tax=Pediculus humanus subsp. corporis TaxID=121224 RepID=E0W458_PEDHC|nr:polyA glycohydrolase, putative [Pediculus humanus corporis]EEB20414.1 polyA glycohydrolase, putative [Pediculus humanus corporis]
MQKLFQEKTYSSDFVLMPWDDTLRINISNGDCEESCTRWDMILKQLDLSNQILNCLDLINIIKSYNIVVDKNGKQSQPFWKFFILQKYFSNLNDNEVREFFQEDGTLSTIRHLALELKTLVPKLELLKTGKNSVINLHQIQIASLLANAFLCTFPKGKADCPSFNFISLYESSIGPSVNCNIEKLKCIVHYFNKIKKKHPGGLLSFHRLCIPDHKFPRWDKTSVALTSLTVDAKGKIEDQNGFLQMDFANKYVGGGVLGRGCVQEEIRFIICPELIAARLFTESLADNEALFIAGAERYCNYSGYASTFKYGGNYDDVTEMDESGRRKTYLIVVDALYFHRFPEQFRESKILRELKKAYVGFKPLEDGLPLPLATGNWGCGAFGGDPQLKSLIQLMASSQARRNMLYLTFGDLALKKQIEEVYNLLVENNVNVGMLYRIIRLYHREKRKSQTVFQFVKELIEKNNEKRNQQIPTTSEFRAISATENAKLNNTTECADDGEDSINFPDMDVDFEDLDENDVKRNKFSFECQSSSSSNKEEKFITTDTIWYENEINFHKGTKDQTVDLENNLSSSQNLFSDEKMENFREKKSPEGCANNQNDSGSTKESNFPHTKTPNEEKNNKQQFIKSEKKFVQKKITDCYFITKK